MSNSFYGRFQFISLWIRENPSWIWDLLPEANSLVSIPSREYHVCFLQTFVTSRDHLRITRSILTVPSVRSKYRGFGCSRRRWKRITKWNTGYERINYQWHKGNRCTGCISSSSYNFRSLLVFERWLLTGWGTKPLKSGIYLGWRKSWNFFGSGDGGMTQRQKGE